MLGFEVYGRGIELTVPRKNFIGDGSAGGVIVLVTYTSIVKAVVLLKPSAVEQVRSNV